MRVGTARGCAKCTLRRRVGVRTRTLAMERLSGPADVDALPAHHRVHRTVELGLGLTDDVLARRPRRNVGQQQFTDAGPFGDLSRLGARQMQMRRALRCVRPGRLAQEDVGPAGQLDQRLDVELELAGVAVGEMQFSGSMATRVPWEVPAG